MPQTVINVVGKDHENPRLGNLEYGTIFTEAPNHPGSFYIKINKSNMGQGCSMNCPPKHSLALNLKSGTVRAICGSARVQVMKATIDLMPVSSDDAAVYTKSGC